MELETLKQMWQTYDQKLDQRLQVNKAFLKEVSFDSLKSRLWEFRLCLSLIHISNLQVRVQGLVLALHMIL